MIDTFLMTYVIASRIFELILSEIEASGLSAALDVGLVVAGGSSNIKGLSDFVSKKFACPIKIHQEQIFTNSNSDETNASMVTALGLLKYASRSLTAHSGSKQLNWKAMYQRVKQWLVGNF